MRGAKLWLALVVVLGFVGASAALFVPQLLQAELDGQVRQRLASVGAGAQALVKLHSRRWLDATAHAATDGTLGEALEAASHGASNAALLHKTAIERLRAWNAEWRAYEVIAVDVKRKVLARVGASGEDAWGDDLSEAQVVNEALRGYVLDDTWSIGGRVLRVAAAPVVVRERYAGALLVVLDLGADLAPELHDKLGTDLAVVAGGKVIARGGQAALLDEAPSLLARHASEIQANGHTEPLPLGPDGSWGMVAITLPGEAAADGAALVLLAERPQLTSVLGLLQRVRADKLPWLQVVPLALASLLVLAVGLWLIRREHDARLERLTQALQAAARSSDAPHVDDRAHPGRFGVLARAVNAAVDKAARAAAPTRTADPAPVGLSRGAIEQGIALPDDDDIERLLSPRKTPARVRAVAAKVPAPAPAPAPVAEPASTTASEGTAEPAGGVMIGAPPSTLLPDETDRYTGPPAFDELPAPEPSPLLSGGFSDGAKPAATAAPAAPAPTATAAPSEAQRPAKPTRTSPPANPFEPQRPLRPVPITARSEAAAIRDLRAPDATTRTPNLPSAIASRRPPERPVAAPAPLPPAPPPAATLAPPPAATVAPTGEQDYRAVYTEFLDTRQRCGETVEGLTYEKFSGRLRDQRATLMERYRCLGVRFTVYVKDGKAALKAQPVN